MEARWWRAAVKESSSGQARGVVPDGSRGRVSGKRQLEQESGEVSDAEGGCDGGDGGAGGVDGGAGNEGEYSGEWLVPTLYSGGDGRARTCEDPILVLPTQQHCERGLVALGVDEMPSNELAVIQD